MRSQIKKIIVFFSWILIKVGVKFNVHKHLKFKHTDISLFKLSNFVQISRFNAGRIG